MVYGVADACVFAHGFLLLLQNTLVFHGILNGAAILSIPHRKKDFTHRATLRRRRANTPKEFFDRHISKVRHALSGVKKACSEKTLYETPRSADSVWMTAHPETIHQAVRTLNGRRGSCDAW